MCKDRIQFADDFQSCHRTYVTICFYHAASDPSVVTNILKLDPSRTAKKNRSGWFLTTKDICNSRDFRRHVVEILNNIQDKSKEMEQLRNSGWEINMQCFWVSSSGNGGPIFDRNFMKYVSEFDLDIHFDIWFGED